MDSFVFPAYKRLKHSLGKSDAVSEFTQLSLELLLSELQKASNPNEKLTEISALFGIRVNNFDESMVRNRKAHLDILAVYEIAEDFMRSLRRESKVTWTDNKQGEDYLTWYWRNLPIASRENERGILLKDLFDYYRRVRNEFMHSKQEAGKLAKSAAALALAKQHVPDFSKLKAPTAYDEIGFDDVVLFTRVTKELGEFLCKCLKPSEKNLPAILEDCYETETGKKLIELRRINDPERRRNAFLSMLKRYFSLNDADATHVVESLLEGC